MKERGILFQGAMVRALLADLKTQTRRVVKPTPTETQWIEERENGFYVCADGEPTCYTGVWQTHEYAHVSPIRCPYGQPGDRLWVRETWSHTGTGVWTIANARAALDGSPIYRADGERPGVKWWPGIHMPREFCRILLEVTGVRVERLQAISEADAKAEGVRKPMQIADDDPRIYRDAFGDLWEQINGPGSWDANPLVWVVEFKRAAPGGPQG